VGAARPDGLAPLPRRVPQTSLAVELREDAPAVAEQEDADEFTADHAASSLAGFQLGTLRARDEDDLLDTQENAITATSTETDPLDTPETPHTPQDAPPPSTPEETAPIDQEQPAGAAAQPAPAEAAPPGTPHDAAVAARGLRIDRS
jgi:hypothetical protein